MPTSEYPKVTVSALSGGKLTLPLSRFCSDKYDSDQRYTVPSLSFLITHKPSGSKIVFDLGLRRNLKDYPSALVPHLESRQPILVTEDVKWSLDNGGVDPTEINYVILSHVHWDHIGTPTDFPNSKFIVGPGTKSLLKNGIGNYNSVAVFEPDMLPEGRTIELSAPGSENEDMKQLSWKWTSIGPLKNVVDVFNDGSIYLVDCPGHLPGHTNLLVRISSEKWVYLAGDALHHRRILTGECGMATWQENNRTVCIHLDKEQAEKSLQVIQNVTSSGIDSHPVEVIFAHARDWADENKHRFLPNFL